jgi:polysaccharide biosynthesis/export protein ExoF
LRAAGETTTQLSDDLAKVLQERQKLPERPFVSAEVVKFRPFYVLGDAQQPGEHLFRPGMTMDMALSVAGGIYRPSQTQPLRFERDAIMSRGALGSIQSKRSELIARQLRIQSELAGADSIRQLPEMGATDFQTALAQETAIMKTRRQRLSNQQASYRRQIELSNEEINFLKARMESAVRQQLTVESELRQYKTLGDKGLALSSRTSALDRLLAQIEGDQRDIDTRIARSRQNIAQAEAAIVNLMDEYKKELTADLRQISTQVSDLNHQSAMHRDLIVEAETSGTISHQAQSARLSYRIQFSVARQDNGEVKEFTADKHDRVEPGDVITVKQQFEYGAAATLTRERIQ